MEANELNESEFRMFFALLIRDTVSTIRTSI